MDDAFESEATDRPKQLRSLGVCFGQLCLIALTALFGLARDVSAEESYSRTYTIYVATDGNDGYSGRQASVDSESHDGPVRTIEHAKELIAEARKKDTRRVYSYRILLRGGHYELFAPLLLGPSDSGGAGAPVIYASYPGETAYLSGGHVVSPWSNKRENLWTASCAVCTDSGDSPHEMFVNGARRERPRLPPGRAFQIQGVPTSSLGNTAAHDTFYVQHGDLPDSLSGDDDAEVVILHIWKVSRALLASFDPRANIVELNSKSDPHGAMSAPAKGFPYFVDNAGDVSRSEQTWKYDRRSRLFSYSSAANEDVASAKITVPRLTNLVTIRGSATDDVHDIAFQGIVFEFADWTLPAGGREAVQAEAGLPSAIVIEAAHSITLSHIAVIHSGADAIRVGRRSHDIEISKSEFRDLGGTAIAIGLDQRSPPTRGAWDAPDSFPDRVHSISVRDNLIASVGRVSLGAVGIWVGQADHVVVEQNEIRDIYYSGISVGWTWGYGPSLSHDNRVASNLIYNYGQGVLSDFGGVYTLGRQTGTIVENNIIHDGYARTYGGNGLYADEGTSGVIFRNNLVYGVSDAGIHLHYGRDDIFEGNIISHFGKTGLRCSSGAEESSATFRGNIFYSSGSPVLTGMCGDKTYVFVSNDFWSLSGLPRLFDETRRSRQMRELPGELTSDNLFVDPSFIAPEEGNYRFSSVSPLIGRINGAFEGAGRVTKIELTTGMQDGPPEFQEGAFLAGTGSANTTR